MEDSEQRAVLLAALDNSVVALLADSAKDWMKLPYSSADAVGDLNQSRVVAVPTNEESNDQAFR